MKVYTRDYRTEHISGRAYSRYFGGLKPCVFDIETTGLDPSRCKVIMTALLTEIEDGVRITQFLAENHYEEEKVIEATMDFLRREGIDYLITFNGAGFDIPFMNRRMEKLIMAEHMSCYNLDIYRFIKRQTVLPRIMKSLRQKMVEEYFGIAGSRRDTISGRESVLLYERYALSGDSIAEKTILTHNREDVLQLYRITEHISRDDFEDCLRDSSFDSAIASYGMPVTYSSKGICLSAASELKAGSVVITGTQLIRPISAAVFRDSERSIDADFRAASQSYEIRITPRLYKGSIFIPIPELGISTHEADYLRKLSSCLDDCLVLKNGDIIDREAINTLSLSVARSYYEEYSK